VQGAKDLLESERGWFCLAVLAAATLLVALKAITGADWISVAKYLVVTLVASKTVSSALDTRNAAVQTPTASS
jgi:hypothetical protein